LVFSGIPFLYYFFTIVLLLYFVVPRQLKNVVLLVSSLLFYAWGERLNIIIMLIAIASGYFFGILTEKYRGQKLSSVFMIISICISGAMLAYFKYADFFIENINIVTGLSIPLLKVALPIGISFYTFQIISYNVDVWRGDVPAQKNIFTFATYV